MKKVSLIAVLQSHETELQLGLRDLASFTQKLPLLWELILVIDPEKNLPDDKTISIATQFKAEHFEVKILANIHRQPRGRGPSVLAGLQASTGDYIVLFPIDLTVPLAEVFNFLQELVTQTETQFVIGNRLTSKKKLQTQKTSWHQTLEKIILEKNRQHQFSVEDPLCSYWALTRQALNLILPELRLRSWYYTPEILVALNRHQLKIIQVPILSKDQRASQIPLIREFFRNLF